MWIGEQIGMVGLGQQSKVNKKGIANSVFRTLHSRDVARKTGMVWVEKWGWSLKYYIKFQYLWHNFIKNLQSQ